MKKNKWLRGLALSVGALAVLIAVSGLVSCADLFGSDGGGGGGGSSVSTADLEGIWVAVGDDGGTGKAILFEFSGNDVTRIAYSELAASDPDGPDMFQDEGSTGTFSVSDDTLSVTVTQEWENAQWSVANETRSVPIDLQGDILTMDFPEIGEIPFEKKSFSLPSALVDTWYELPEGENTLIGEADGTYSYTDPGDPDDYTAEGTWSATADLLRIITTDDSDSASSFYIENLYEYVITGRDLTLYWDDTDFYEYTNVAP